MVCFCLFKLYAVSLNGKSKAYSTTASLCRSITYRAAGNEYFRGVVADNVSRYLSTTSKIEKGSVIVSIVETVRSGSPQAGFVRQDPRSGGWFVVDDAAAREKVGATMRSLIKTSRVENPVPGESRRQDDNDFWKGSVQDADHLLDWIPLSIVANVPLKQGEETHCGDFLNFKAELSPWEIFDAALWKISGFDLNQEELNMLIEEVEFDHECKQSHIACHSSCVCSSDYLSSMIQMNE
jgi:hypothetical protein